MAVTTPITVRYRDLDTENHVNNAVFATYLEVGRTDYVDLVFEVGLANYNFVIASLSIDYERRITIEDDVEVRTEVPELGESSVPMTYEITANGETAATAETTLVFVDPESGRSAPIPQEIRDRIEAHERL